VLEDDLGCDPLVPVDAAEGPDDDS
jgi:hypothetical protein